jgi:hypothetical protein
VGGGHCGFNDWHAFCEFGEFASQNQMTLNRDEQQAQLFTYLIPWLEWRSKTDPEGRLSDLNLEPSERTRIQVHCSNER